LSVVKGAFRDAVGSWQGLDSTYYGGETVDRSECLRVAKGEKGEGEVIHISAW
jgi:hypothetical protein